MRTLWVLILSLVVLTTAQGCKRQPPEPIPGPKATSAAASPARAAGIAWFQGSLDEAFARPGLNRDARKTCDAMRDTHGAACTRPATGA